MGAGAQTHAVTEAVVVVGDAGARGQQWSRQRSRGFTQRQLPPLLDVLGNDHLEAEDVQTRCSRRRVDPIDSAFEAIDSGGAQLDRLAMSWPAAPRRPRTRTRSPMTWCKRRSSGGSWV